MASGFRIIEWAPNYRVNRKGVVQSNCRDGIWRTLKPGATNTGHLYVSLAILGANCKSVFVHRLVLETFVGPCPPGMEARHFPDRDPTNNNVENLSWATRTVNQGDRKIHGTDNRRPKVGV